MPVGVIDYIAQYDPGISIILLNMFRDKKCLLALMVRKCNSLFKELVRVPRAPF